MRALEAGKTRGKIVITVYELIAVGMVRPQIDRR
jgi:hypothetical protein